jgi:hypothetical protein
MTPAEIVLDFVDCINQRDAGNLADISDLSRYLVPRRSFRTGTGWPYSGFAPSVHPVRALTDMR